MEWAGTGGRWEMEDGRARTEGEFCPLIYANLREWKNLTVVWIQKDVLGPCAGAEVPSSDVLPLLVVS